jgi:hypothetical protein
MSNYLSTIQLVIFTLILYVWSAESILFPGEKQGESKKDFVLREFNAVFDAKLPNVPLIDTIQALLSGLLGRVIDWLVAKLKTSGDMKKLEEMIAGFFPTTAA